MTTEGGASNGGTVFEDPGGLKDRSSVLASFDDPQESAGAQGLAVDSQGNLFGALRRRQRQLGAGGDV